MKLETAVLLSILFPAVALAQSAPAPETGVSPSVQPPAHMRAREEHGMVRDVPKRGVIGTTGSALSPEPTVVPPAPMTKGRAVPDDLGFRNVSPASPVEGIEKER